MNERIKLVRETLQMTQAEFAKRLGMGQSTLAMLEVGKREILSRHIKTICSLFGVNEEWILTGKGDMFCQTSQELIDVLDCKFSLGEHGRKILEVYLGLNELQRGTVDRFLLSMVETASRENVEFSTDLMFDKQKKSERDNEEAVTLEKDEEEFLEQALQYYRDEKREVQQVSPVKKSDGGGKVSNITDKRTVNTTTTDERIS